MATSAINSETAPTLFQRFLLPGLAFKGFVIGGGYATGRELAEFFLGAGPAGGVAGMLLTMVIWSAVCAISFGFAHAFKTFNYRRFFGELLGPFWIAFEVSYLALLLLILSVIAAAAGEIGAQVFGLPTIVGSIALISAIILITTFGNAAAENLFRYASPFIYISYAIFLVLAFTHFGDRIGPAFSEHSSNASWMMSGVSYASYNVVALIAVLPFIQRLKKRSDAVIAGALAGPLALLPALGFFLCMLAYYPEIADAPLPSDFLLRNMDAPWFQVVFQLMIFTALMETGVGGVNAVNERIAGAVKRHRNIELSTLSRFAISAAMLVGAAFVAGRIGLIELVASGYGFLGYIMLGILVAPVLTVGLWRLINCPKN